MASSRRSGRRQAGSGADQETDDKNGYMQVFVKPLDSASYGELLAILGVPRPDLSERQRWVLAGSGVVVGVWLVYHVDVEYLFHRLCAVFVPLFSILCAYSWLAFSLRKAWSTTSVYLLFCACFLGEVIGQCVQDAGADWVFGGSDASGSSSAASPEEPDEQQDMRRNPMPPLLLSSSSAAAASVILLRSMLLLGPLLLAVVTSCLFSALPPAQNAAVVAVVLLTRLLACTQLDDLPVAVRPFFAYVCGICGVITAKYVEAAATAAAAAAARPAVAADLIGHDGKIAVIRRRRTSSSAGLHGLSHKTRRTSLPAISIQRSHLQGAQVTIFQ